MNKKIILSQFSLTKVQKLKNKGIKLSITTQLFFIPCRPLFIFTQLCIIIENPNTCYFTDSNRPVDVTPIIEPIFPPVTPNLPPLTCEFGRQIDQQRRCTNFITDVPQCPRGFFCNFGPADEPGPCCLGE